MNFYPFKFTPEDVKDTLDRVIKCVWVESEEADARVYQTGCTDGGTLHFFEAGNVESNGYNYCPYCGKLIGEK